MLAWRKSFLKFVSSDGCEPASNCLCSTVLPQWWGDSKFTPATVFWFCHTDMAGIGHALHTHYVCVTVIQCHGDILADVSVSNSPWDLWHLVPSSSLLKKRFKKITPICFNCTRPTCSFSSGVLVVLSRWTQVLTSTELKMKPVWQDLNPKAITTDELHMGPDQHREWKDGLYSTIITETFLIWPMTTYKVDCDVDTKWIEISH